MTDFILLCMYIFAPLLVLCFVFYSVNKRK